jgi:hypothetical protein
MTIMCGPGEPSEHDLAEVAKFAAFLEKAGPPPPSGLTVADIKSRLQGGPPPCPECVQGKHPNCDGYTWDDELDEPTACPCDVAGHPN